MSRPRTFDSEHQENSMLRRLANLSYHRQLNLMLVPYVVGLGILVIIPFTITIALSFTDYDIFSAPTWNSFRNYTNFLTDQLFQRALYNSIWFAVIGVTLRVSVALLLALALNKSGRAFELARATVYLPTIMPELAYALVWLLILNPGYGPLNQGLHALGLPMPAWLQEPFTARASLVVMFLFQCGEGLVLLLAALQTIPSELFESAHLDGARRFQLFRYLIFPWLTPALLLLSVRDVGLTFSSSFVPGLITTETGPYYSTFFLPHYIYGESFELFRYGYGSAVTVVVFGILGVFSFLFYRLFKRFGNLGIF